MIDIKKFIKGLRILNPTDQTKALELSVNASSTTNTKTIIESIQTSNQTLTLPNATDTLVGKATTDTLTNKSIDADTNTITNIENADIKALAAIARNKLASGTADRVLVNDGAGVLSDSTVITTELNKLSGITGNLTTDSNTQAFTNKTFDADGVGNSITNIENTDIKALAAIDATKIADGSVTSTEFQFINTVTSNVQTQLNDKQPLDATLTSLSAFNTNGLVTQTAADTFTGRTVVAGSTKIAVVNGDGIADNPSIDVTEANLTLNNIGGTLGISKGGTGQVTASAAFDVLSPLTTKGDILTYSTTNARLPVGTNGQVIVADSTQALGVKWATNTPSSTANLSVRTETTTYSAVNTDDLILANGTFTITLPAATGNTGKILYIYNIGTGVITIARAGSDLINGETLQTLPSQYEHIPIVSNGSAAWYIL